MVLGVMLIGVPEVMSLGVLMVLFFGIFEDVLDRVNEVAEGGVFGVVMGVVI